MKKALMIASVLIIAVISTACINNIAVQELNNKAAEYMQKGDYDSAVNRLQASLDLDSTMFETHYNLGVAAFNAKKYDIAIDALENGIKIKPDYAEFYYTLALSQSELANKIVEDKDNSSIYKIEELKKSAIANLNTYLEKNPTTNESETIQALIKELETPTKNQEENKIIKVEG